MAFVAPDYRAEIYKFVADYEGVHEAAIRRTGAVFDFYSRLMVDRRVTGEARRLVAIVLAYFVVPDDVLPEEELGPYGMLDDLYLAAHVYRLLDRQVEPEILAQAWIEDEELGKVMDIVYGESRAALGKQRKDVLALAGLV